MFFSFNCTKNNTGLMLLPYSAYHSCCIYLIICYKLLSSLLMVVYILCIVSNSIERVSIPPSLSLGLPRLFFSTRNT